MNIGEGEQRVLDLVGKSNDKPLNLSNLASKLGITTQAVHVRVNNLEKKNLVKTVKLSKERVVLLNN